MESAPKAFVIGPHTVAPGGRTRCRLRVSRLPTDTWLSVPVEVVNGRGPGPAMWLTAAVHGDELNGVEIISRVLSRIDVETLRGTLVAVPIVNVFGFIGQQRYLPDRRDLNRSFPGSPRGSLAARLANMLINEVVMHCTHGIDLHTGSNHRTNLPHLRGDFDDAETLKLAQAFGVELIKHADTRDGSLRKAAAERGNKVLLFEGGEALRFSEDAIVHGAEGVLRVMQALGMIEYGPPPAEAPPMLVRKSHWLRAKRAGILKISVDPGARIRKGQVVGTIQDTFGQRVCDITARSEGMVIGMTLNPLVTQGDALIHVGTADKTTKEQAPPDPTPEQPPPSAP